MNMLTELELRADNEARHAHRELVEELEAKLAKVMNVLDKIKRIDSLVGVFAACERTLATLEGEADATDT